MKCNKLIKELKKFNPDANVTLTFSEDILLSYITGKTDSDTIKFDKTNTPIIFIEPIDLED